MAIEKIEQLFTILVSRQGSDLHLKYGSPPVLRINGELTSLPVERMTPETINNLINPILSDKQKKEFSDKKVLDFSYGMPDVARFRINYSMQRGTPRVVARRVPYEIKKLEELNLPSDVLKDFCSKESGLVLVTGPTGCGKSTTLAGMIDYINNTRNCHVVTVEDPIEFLHKDQKAMITQQEVKIDIESFPMALENMLRQDPDVMVVGEMRNYEAMQTVLNASETGHLVLSTLHTTSAASS
ncbi:MAG: ATPase, T2SS/T4P/T4SS family, partial [Nanoarchaeota archaeon]|nr:ATPase, T2SS/T4P/T4SS family [Nanoarchaeota archaeon]